MTFITSEIWRSLQLAANGCFSHVTTSECATDDKRDEARKRRPRARAGAGGNGRRRQRRRLRVTLHLRNTNSSDGDDDGRGREMGILKERECRPFPSRPLAIAVPFVDSFA